MKVELQIQDCLSSQPQPKQRDMRTIHALILSLYPTCTLWFSDGLNSDKKPIANPTIGYGRHTMRYANGSTKDVFQLGMSVNKTGISLHILGSKYKTYLLENFGSTLGKASITGYCIRFTSLRDIHLPTLSALIEYGLTPKDE